MFGSGFVGGGGEIRADFVDLTGAGVKENNLVNFMHLFESSGV